MAKREWYRIQAAAKGPAADVWIYDLIGESFWGESVSAKQFLKDIQALPEDVKTIRVHVNSPGGDPFDATAMHNLLRAQADAGRSVEVIIEGLAASAATIVTSAGDKVKIASNALLMVHNPSGFAMGNAEDMRQMADTLDVVGNSTVASYQRLSALNAKEIKAMMDAETWMDAETAVENGFATEVIEPVKVAASLDPRSVKSLGKIPDQFKARVAELVRTPEQEQPKVKPADAVDVLAAAEAAGMDTKFALELVQAELPMEQVTARIQLAVETRTKSKKREAEIRAACDLAKLPELADAYVQGAMTVEQVKAQLVTISAKMHKAEIDSGLQPDKGKDVKGKPVINIQEIYAEMNRPRLQAGRS